MAKQKHLTTEQRSTIQDMLSNKCTFTEIGDAIGKDPSTVAKEIKKHLNFSKVGYRYVKFNACSKRKTCEKKHVCTSCNRDTAS